MIFHTEGKFFLAIAACQHNFFQAFRAGLGRGFGLLVLLQSSKLIFLHRSRGRVLLFFFVSLGISLVCCNGFGSRCDIVCVTRLIRFGSDRSTSRCLLLFARVFSSGGWLGLNL